MLQPFFQSRQKPVLNICKLVCLHNYCPVSTNDNKSIFLFCFSRLRDQITKASKCCFPIQAHSHTCLNSLIYTEDTKPCKQFSVKQIARSLNCILHSANFADIWWKQVVRHGRLPPWCFLILCFPTVFEPRRKSDTRFHLTQREPRRAKTEAARGAHSQESEHGLSLARGQAL